MKAVLLERNICGGGSTGKSSRFLAPDGELEFAQILRRFGPKGTKDLWQVATKGVEIVTTAIRQRGIQCDLVKQDSLFLGNGRNGWKAVEEEAHTRKMLGYLYETYDGLFLRYAETKNDSRLVKERAVRHHG